MDVVAWSAMETERLRAPLGARWAHTQAVALRAEEIAVAVPLDEREVLLAAAYVHDIGYAPELSKTGFHPLDGATWLRRQGHERLARLIAHHSGARFEAALRGYTEALARFPEETSPVADALTYCDLTTGPGGEPRRVEHRLREIERRHGTTSQIALAVDAAMETLLAAVTRTEARLEQPRVD